MSVPAPKLWPMKAADVTDAYRLDGFLTPAALSRLGITRSVLRILVQKGELVSVALGVYVSADYAARVRLFRGGELALRVGAQLANMAPGAVASHQTAAGLHELDVLGPPEDLAITRPPGTSRTGKPGVRVHATRLPRKHVTEQLGVPVTTVARTVVDLARSTSFRDGVVVADSALRMNLTSKPRLRQVLAECGPIRGTQRARDVIEFADALSESVLESIGRVAFAESGLPKPELQVQIGVPKVFARTDYLWRQYWTIAEADGVLKYDDRTHAVRQLERDTRLRDAGFEVVHFGWREIMHEPETVVARIRTAFRRGSALHRAAGA
jgi:very-short-patch-repair endonuclease